MSRRPGVAAHADARAEGPSRRALIAGVSVAPLLGGTEHSANDQCVSACENWLALNAEQDRLARRWSKLESKLAREHNFLALSRRQQRKLPEARELYEIDDRLEELHEEQHTLLQILPTLVATSALGLAGKLAVAAMEVRREENEEAHFLVASILRDLKTMMPTSV